MRIKKSIIIALASILIITGAIAFAFAFSSSSSTIVHTSMGVPGTEYPVTIEANTNAWMVQGQASAPIKFSNVAGGTSTSTGYITIPAGGRWQESGMLLYANQTWYFSCTSTNELEIQKWAVK